MRHVAKNLTVRSGQMGLIALLACTLATQISFARSGVEGSTPEDASAPSMVLNDQYKFTQLNFTPFVIDQFSGFDYTGYKVYKVYLHTVNSTDYIKRIFGNEDYPGAITAPSGIYNNNFCVGATSGGVPPPGFFYGGYNAHEIDSWVGIGVTAFPNEFAGEEDVVLDTLSTNDWSSNFILESMSSGNYGPVDIFLDDEDTEGGWHLDSPDALNGFAGDDYKAIVMQLTTDSIFTWTLSAEIWIEGDSTNAVIVTQTFNGVSMELPEIVGCTDILACNYYDLANTDNGSCDYPEQYYDCDDVCLSDIDEDGVCDELEIDGCTSALACNYNTSATDDDASCVFPEGCDSCSGESDGTGSVVDNDDDGDGVCNSDEVVGCQDDTACNYDASATDSGTCTYVDGICESCSGETDGTGTVVDNDADNDTVCDLDEVIGCQDALACNYMSAATDAGSCEYATGCDYCSGETDGSGEIVDGDTDGDTTCDVDEIAGCQDTTACNYDASATDSDGSCEYCSCGQLTGMSPYSLTVEEHAVDGIPGHTTYRLYVNMADPNDYLNGVYGESPGAVSEPFVLTSTSTPNWYNNEDVSADFGWEITPFMLAALESAAYDSWFTTGPEFGPPGDFFTTYGSAGTGFWPAFNAGEDINITSESGFSIYNVPNCDLPPGSEGSSCDQNHPAVAGDDGRVLVAQITSEGLISGEFSVSILQNGSYGSGVYHTEHFQFNGVGSFSSDGWGGAMSSEYQDCGCTDATALNFDDEALYDDGGCIPVINGCMDSDACNYMDTATVDDESCLIPVDCETCSGETDGSGSVVDNDSDNDGVCDADEIVGCQDDTACNYNSSATDAAACIYVDGVCETCSGETDGTGTIVDNDSDNDGVCDADEVEGCQDSTACNYMTTATDSGACVYPSGCESCTGETDGSGTVLANDSDNDGVCDADEIVGCQDDTACNYDSSATDAAACIYVDGVCETCSGETDGTGSIVDNDSDNDGVCDADEVEGCQDSTACNYDELATDEGTCIYADGTCESCSGSANNGTGTVVVNDADEDGICDADEIEGCQDDTACNYDSSATDAAACIYVDGVCETCSGETDGTGTIVDNDSDNDGVCDADEVEGCQDSTACNYMTTATDSGACVYPSGCESCTGETDGSGTVLANDSDNDGVCDADEIVGCQDDTACNYDSSATDAAACIYVDGVCETCSGETDGTGSIVDNDSDNDGVCDADEVEGCQDSTACNYDELATDEGTCIYADGTCESCSGSANNGTGTVVVNDADDDGICDADEVPGCQNQDACNYNALATDENGSCTYATGCDECAGSVDDGTGYVNDLDADNDGVCDSDEIPGCQDSTACNFNSSATDEDGSCTYASSGCESCSGATDGSGMVLANDDDEDGICNADEIEGCQDPLACNWNSNATDPGVDCIYAFGCDGCSGETDGSGSVVDNDADDDGVCDTDEVIGCQDSAACNFNPLATDAGECFIAGPYYNCLGECVNDADDDGVCDEIDALIFNSYTDGYGDGYDYALTQCTGGPEYCGEGTVWSDDFQMCVEDGACPGDLNGDLVVGTGDLLMLLMDYGFDCD